MNAGDIEILHVLHASPVSAISTAAGPRRLLQAGLAERLTRAGARVAVRRIPPPEATDGITNPVAEAFEVAAAVARGVDGALERGRLAVVLSGSCHVGLGSASGLRGRARGIVWLDAHGDFNTPDTTRSGLLDGTVLATLTGRAWGALSARVEGYAPVPDDTVLLVGARELDPGEADLLEGSALRRLSVADVREGGAREALAAFADGLEAVYVHVDLDVLDPSAGTANAFAAPDGLSRAELSELLRTVAAACPVRAFGLASYDPAYDEEGRACEAALEAVEAIAMAGRDAHRRRSRCAGPPGPGGPGGP